MTEKRIKIVLVEDHRVMREGLRLLLERQPDLEVAGEAGDGPGALECVSRCLPDVVVMDIGLPGENGIALTRKILAARPATRVLILSSQADPACVDDALEAGASGYVLKDSGADEIVRAIRAVLAGSLYLCAEMTTAVLLAHRKRLAAGPAPARPLLSGREREVLELVAEGRRNKEIAARLSVTNKSVETYRSRLMRKVGCQNTADLVRYAIREKIVCA